MKKSDWILAGAIVLAACVSAFFFYGNREKGTCISIQVDGVEYGRYDLETERVIEIGETNRLEIRDGEASMVHADCPDQICVQMAPISELHELIVCMPNKVVVEVVEK